MASKEFKITPGQLIFPLSLTAFVVFLMLAIQTSQLLQERDALHLAEAQQEKPLADAQKLDVQLNALAVGTKKLADGGNKDAQTIIDRMKQIGITVGAPKTASPATPPAAPAATDAAPAKPAPESGE